MDWKAIGLAICLVGIGYLVGNLYPLSRRIDVVYNNYIQSPKETIYKDTIIIHNYNKTIIEKEFIKDTTYINTIPDSLLLQAAMFRANKLFGN